MRDNIFAKRKKHANKMFNERLKLLSGAINTLGLAVMVSAFIFPIIREGNFIALGQLFTWVWMVAGVILHLSAQYLLGFLKLED